MTKSVGLPLPRMRKDRPVISSVLVFVSFPLLKMLIMVHHLTRSAECIVWLAAVMLVFDIDYVN